MIRLMRFDFDFQQALLYLFVGTLTCGSLFLLEYLEVVHWFRTAWMLRGTPRATRDYVRMRRFLLQRSVAPGKVMRLTDQF